MIHRELSFLFKYNFNLVFDMERKRLKNFDVYRNFRLSKLILLRINSVELKKRDH